MSQENVKRARQASEALARDGLEAALSYFHRDVEWLVPEWPEGQVFQGHDGVRRAFDLMDDVFDSYRLDLERIIDCPGDHVVVLLYQRGSIDGSEIEQRIAYDAELHDGLATRVLVYANWEPALKTAGLEE
ncbi:MAG TPA: nuclear transport factor 2 family protein [Solirubrobacteraceae bacterium]|jgi:ketosteroid isomerase-like protein